MYILYIPRFYPHKGAVTRDLGEPTYKTFNLLTRLSTYLLDISPTAYKTFNLPTRLSTCLQDFQLIY